MEKKRQRRGKCAADQHAEETFGTNPESTTFLKMLQTRCSDEQWLNHHYIQAIDKLEKLFMELTQCNLNDINLFYAQLLLYAYGDNFESNMEEEAKLLGFTKFTDQLANVMEISSSSVAHTPSSKASPRGSHSETTSASSSTNKRKAGLTAPGSGCSSTSGGSSNKKQQRRKSELKPFHLYRVESIPLDSPILSTIAKGFLLRLYYGFTGNSDLLIFRNINKARKFADYLYPWFANQWYNSHCPNACRYVAYPFGVCNLIRLENKRFEDDELLTTIRHCFEYRVYEVQNQSQFLIVDTLDEMEMMMKGTKKTDDNDNTSKSNNKAFERIQSSVHRFPSDMLSIHPNEHPDRFTQFMPIVFDLAHFYEHRMLTGDEEETMLGHDFLRYIVQHHQYLPAVYRLGILLARGKLAATDEVFMNATALLLRCKHRMFSDASIRLKEWLLSKVFDFDPAIDNEALLAQWVAHQNLLLTEFGLDEVTPRAAFRQSTILTNPNDIPANWGFETAFGTSNVQDVLDNIYNKAGSCMVVSAGLFLEPNLIGLCRRAGARFINLTSIPILREECHLKMNRLVKAILSVLVQDYGLLGSSIDNGKKRIVLDKSVVSRLAKQFDMTLINEEEGLKELIASSSMNDKQVVASSSSSSSRPKSMDASPSMFSSYFHYIHHEDSYLSWEGLCRSLFLSKDRDYHMKWQLVMSRDLYLRDRSLFIIDPIHTKPSSRLGKALHFMFGLDDDLFRYIVSYFGFNPSISYLDSYMRFPIDTIATMSGDVFPQTLQQWEDHCERYSMAISDTFPSTQLTFLHVQAARGRLNDVEDLIRRHGMSPNVIVPTIMDDTDNGDENKASRLWFEGFTPLHFAANNGHHDVVHRLLELGATLNIAQTGRCAGMRQFEVLSSMIEDIHNRGETALEGAVKAGHHKVVKAMIKWEQQERQQQRRAIRQLMQQPVSANDNTVDMNTNARNDQERLTTELLDEEESRVRDNHDLTLKLENWKGLNSVVYNTTRTADESNIVHDTAMIMYPNGLLYHALANNRIGVVRELIHGLSLCKLHRITDLLPTIDDKLQPQGQGIALRENIVQRILHDVNRPDVKNFIVSCVEYAMNTNGPVYASTTTAEGSLPAHCFLQEQANSAAQLFAQRYLQHQPFEAHKVNTVSSTTDCRNGEGNGISRLHFSRLIEQMLHDHFSSRRPFEEFAILALNKLIEFAVERLVFLIAEDVKLGEDQLYQRPAYCSQRIQDHLFGIDRLDEDETLWSCATNSPHYYKKKYPRYNKSISQGLVAERLSQSEVLQLLCCGDCSSEKVIPFLQSLLNQDSSSSSSNHNSDKQLLIPSKYLLSMVASFCDQLEFWLFYLIEGSHNDSYNNSPFFKTVTLENVQRFIENQDIFARFRQDEVVACGYTSRFFIDEEDSIVHTAYMLRRKLKASSDGYKDDIFELDPLIKRYDHPFNDDRFIVCNGKQEVNYYRNQNKRLVISVNDFRQIFLSRFRTIFDRFLFHQYGSEGILDGTLNENENRMPQVDFDEDVLYFIQFLFEYMMIKYISSVHNAYCSPWLLISFRVNPHSEKYLESGPRPSENQVAEIDFLRAVLAPEEIERKYDCGGLHQDMQGNHALRRSFALELGEN